MARPGIEPGPLTYYSGVLPTALRVVRWCDVLGKLPVPGRPTIWITVGQGPTALTVGAGGVVWTFYSHLLLLSSFSLSLGDGPI